MKYPFLLLVWFLFSGTGHMCARAQSITLSGTVADQETGEPLEFATIGVKGKPLGTISNAQGDFDFHLPAQYRNETLVVMYLGYKSYEAPLWTLLDTQPVNIRLEKSTYLLNEIVVKDSLAAGEILTISLSRVDQNYPDKPFILDAFYRDAKQVGGTYISLLEAAIKIFDEDYRAPRNKSKLRERVALLEVRRSLGYGNKFTTYFDESNLLEELLLNNNVRYRQFPEESVFFESLIRERDSYYNGHEVFVVAHYENYFLRVYIDKATYAIIHLEYENKAEDVIGRKRGMERRFVGIKRTLDFKQYEGKFFLNYILLDSKINWYDLRSGKLRFETVLNQQLLVNHVYTNTTERISTYEKMRSYGLQYQDQPYNKAFWEKYNVIKETPLDKRIREDLEKREGPLEKQFESGGLL